MKQEENDVPTKLLGIPLSDAILIASAPLFAYLLVFIYQAGHCDAFGIPRQLITLAVIDVLGTGSKILGAFFLIFGAVNLLSFLLPRHMPDPLKRSILQALPIFLFIFPVVWFYDWGLTSILLSIFMLLIISIMFFPPLFARRHKGSYLQRMEALDNGVASTNIWEGSLLNRTIDAVGHNTFIAIVYLLLAAHLTYTAGKGSAASQKVFFVTNTSPEAVVLFITSERLIIAPVDRTAKLIEPAFTIVTITNGTDLTLRPVELGPLKVKRLSGAQPQASSGRKPHNARFRR